MYLPTPEELSASSLVQRFGLDGRVQIEHLGHSRAGRPIPLLSFGEGPQSALIVGAPHPNEPTGCLTILRMLAHLAASPNFASTPDWQWHFLPAIDIDGIALNEGWLGDAPTIESYLAHFFRPPFRLQPEYSFPLDLPGYRFADQTPESACWRKALDIAQPRLQCSLHGADTGGAFFIISEDFPDLAGELAGLPAPFGISLNEIGEPFAEMTAFQPGVFSFPSVADIVSQGDYAGATPGSSWGAGDSSAGFARRRFGTFSMTCEVPLWRDAREDDPATSDRTLGDVLEERIRLLREDVTLATTWLPSMRPRSESFEAWSLTESLQDSLATNTAMITALEQARPGASDDRHLLMRELVWFEAGTYGMRVPAMLLRLAVIAGAGVAETAARNGLDSRLAAHRSRTRLSPVPLARATDLQIHAVLTTARFLDTGDANQPTLTARPTATSDTGIGTQFGKVR